MPPFIASILFTIFILFLFYRDQEKNSGVTKAVWVPMIWMFIVGSRFVSQWLNLGGSINTDFVEGSPLDRLFFLFINILGVYILLKRNINWGKIFTNNYLIILFFLFGAFSIVWSDYPFVSFKRLIKALANFILPLIILTEPHPYRAIGFIFRKLSFIMIPLSVLFIKYYPHLGRSYHMGEPAFSGIARQKNGLGAICLIFGIYYAWVFLIQRDEGKKIIKRLNPVPLSIILLMTGWSLYKSNSMTSLMCLFVSLGILFFSSRKISIKTPALIFTSALFFPMVYFFLDYTFDLYYVILEALGRDPTLTTRVPMWEFLLSMVKNPILGFGYESFWLGSRQELMIAEFAIARQAHNGYLNIYLDLGLVGLGFVVLWFVTGFLKYGDMQISIITITILRLAFFVAIALHNWTEASFYGINNVWMLFF